MVEPYWMCIQFSVDMTSFLLATNSKLSASLCEKSTWLHYGSRLKGVRHFHCTYAKLSQSLKAVNLI